MPLRQSPALHPIADLNPSEHSWPQRLRQRIESAGTAAVLGLDPNPAELSERYGTSDGSDAEEAMRVLRWCEDMLEQTRELFPAVKLQAAWFELHGSAGLLAMEKASQIAADAGLLVIADVKRGDIGVSAEAYARAWIGRGHSGKPRADAMTLLPWLGGESMPALRAQCADSGTGAFLCARTSNPGAELLQEALVRDKADQDMYAWEAVAQLAAQGAPKEDNPIGLVVGANHPDLARQIRERYPGLILLVPGFGAQGGDIRRAADFLEDGSKALFPSSRAITYGEGSVRERALSYRDALKKYCQAEAS